MSLNSSTRTFGALLLTIASLVVSTTGGLAQTCSYAMTNVNFGTVNLQSGSPIDTTATLTATCSGVSLLTVRACVSFGNGAGGAGAGGSPRYMLSGTSQLAYNLYSDAARTTVFGTYTGGLLGGATLSVPLNLGGTGSASITIYGRISSGQSITPPGTYASSFAGAETTIYDQYVSLLNCAQILNGAPSRAPFTVLATVQSNCTVSATNMDFGQLTTLANAVDATSTISANCTVTTPYEIALSGGNAAAADPASRRMSGGGQHVVYGLYQNSQRTQLWGSTSGGNTYTGVGTGSSQSITVHGRIAPQATPPPGLYSDTIVVTLTY